MWDRTQSRTHHVDGSSTKCTKMLIWTAATYIHMFYHGIILVLVCISSLPVSAYGYWMLGWSAGVISSILPHAGQILTHTSCHLECYKTIHRMPAEWHQTMYEGTLYTYPYVASSVIQQRMEEPQTAVSPWLGLITDWGDHWLLQIGLRSPRPWFQFLLTWSG